MTGTGDEDHAEILPPDHAVHMPVDEVQPRRRGPVAGEARLDMRPLQRLRQQWIVKQIDLPD